MFARTTHWKGIEGNKQDEAISMFRDQIVPKLRDHEGYEGALLLADRKSGKAIAVTLWASEQALRESEEAVKPLRSKATQQLGVEPTIERYEVAVSDLAAVVTA